MAVSHASSSTYKSATTAGYYLQPPAVGQKSETYLVVAEISYKHHNINDIRS